MRVMQLQPDNPSTALAGANGTLLAQLMQGMQLLPDNASTALAGADGTLLAQLVREMQLPPEATDPGALSSGAQPARAAQDAAALTLASMLAALAGALQSVLAACQSGAQAATDSPAQAMPLPAGAGAVKQAAVMWLQGEKPPEKQAAQATAGSTPLAQDLPALWRAQALDGLSTVQQLLELWPSLVAALQSSPLSGPGIQLNLGEPELLALPVSVPIPWSVTTPAGNAASAALLAELLPWLQDGAAQLPGSASLEQQTLTGQAQLSQAGPAQPAPGLSPLLLDEAVSAAPGSIRWFATGGQMLPAGAQQVGGSVVTGASSIAGGAAVEVALPTGAVLRLVLVPLQAAPGALPDSPAGQSLVRAANTASANGNMLSSQVSASSLQFVAALFSPGSDAPLLTARLSVSRLALPDPATPGRVVAVADRPAAAGGPPLLPSPEVAPATWTDAASAAAALPSQANAPPGPAVTAPVFAHGATLAAEVITQDQLPVNAADIGQPPQIYVAPAPGLTGAAPSQPLIQQHPVPAPGTAWPFTSPAEPEAAAGNLVDSSTPVTATAHELPAGLFGPGMPAPDGLQSLLRGGLVQVDDDPVAAAIRPVPEIDGQAVAAAVPLVKPELLRHAAVESSGLKPELREEPQAPREPPPAIQPTPELRPVAAQTTPQLSAVQSELQRRGLSPSPQPASANREPASGIGFSQLPAQLMQFSSREFELKPYTGLEFHELTARLLEQTASARSSGDGVYQASLDLNPPGLGRMSVNIAVHGESVSLQMAIASTVPKEQLRGSLQALQRSLEEAGLHVVELKVLTVDPDGQPPRQQQDSAGHQPALSIEDEESLRLAFREALAAPVSTTFTGSA
jgi:hypothetical protein